jgi:hypothetical protein
MSSSDQIIAKRLSKPTALRCDWYSAVYGHSNRRCPRSCVRPLNALRSLTAISDLHAQRVDRRRQRRRLLSPTRRTRIFEHAHESAAREMRRDVSPNENVGPRLSIAARMPGTRAPRGGCALLSYLGSRCSNEPARIIHREIRGPSTWRAARTLRDSLRSWSRGDG